ncbi:MAG: PEP-CTERM sorting domain-containing protein [Planctomycetota bacterium]
MLRPILVGVLAGGLAFAMQGATFGQATGWDDDVSDVWTEKFRWTGEVIPDSTIDTTIGRTDNFTVTVDISGAATKNFNFTNSNAVVSIVGDTGSRGLFVNGDAQIDGVLRVGSTGAAGGTFSATGLTTLDGTLQFTGSGTGARSFNSSLQNNGTVSILEDASFSRATATITNDGIFNVAAGKSVSFGGSQTFIQKSGTLQNDGTFHLSADTFRYQGGTIANAFTMAGGNLFLEGGTGAIDVSATSTLQMTGNVLAGQSVTVSGTASTGTLQAQTDFTNSGTVTINADGAAGASLTRSGVGAITNNAGGVINVGGTGTGSRSINANLVNNGTLNINKSAQFSKSVGTLTNNGNLNIAAGESLTLGNSVTFVHQGGHIQNDGALDFSADTFRYQGGTIANAINMAGGSLILEGGTGALDVQASNTLQMTGNVLAGQSVTMTGTASTGTLQAQTDFTNSGTVNVNADGAAGSSLVRSGVGAVTNNAGGVMNFGGSGTGATSLNANLVNNGTLNFNKSTQFSKSSGTLTNNGTVNIAAGQEMTFGTSATFVQAGGTLNVLGDMTLNGDFFEYNGGTINGTVDMSGGTLTFGAGGTGAATFDLNGSVAMHGNVSSGQVVNITSTASSANLNTQTDLVNAGTINVTADGNGQSRIFRAAAGSVTNAAGGVINLNGAGTGNVAIDANFQNNGTVNFNKSGSFSSSSTTFTNDGTVNIAAGQEMTFGSSNTFVQNSGTLDIDGTFTMSSDTFTYNGGVIEGDLGLSNSTLNIGAGTGGFNADFTGTSNNLTGNVLAGQTLNMNATNVGATVSAQADYSNSGTINLNANGTNSATLTRLGTITNNADGVLNFGGTGTGNRVLTADLQNNGTVNVNKSSSFSRGSGTITNNGTMTIAAGEELTFGSSSDFIQQSGTLNVFGDFTMSSDDFVYNGGIINGEIDLNSSSLTFGAGGTGAATFNLTGSGQITGDISSGQVVNIVTDGGSSTQTVQADLVNAGTININNNATQALSLNRSGTITNAASGTINVGGTGTGLRRLSADVVNNGTVNANEDLSLIGGNRTFTNNGQFNIAAGKEVSFGAGSTFVQQAGTLNNGNGGSIQLSSDTFEYNGGTIVGAVDLASSHLILGAGSGAGTFNHTGSGQITGDIKANQVVNLNNTGGTQTLTAQTDFTNSGVINLDSSVTQTTTLSRNGTITNNGDINLTGAGTGSRRLNTSLTNNGTVDAFNTASIGTSTSVHQNLGTITNHANTTMSFDGATFTNLAGGKLAGIGEMDFSSVTGGLVNNGTIAAGSSPGTLVLDGDVFFGSTSTLEVEIGGLLQGTEYDFLSALDTLNLDGSLDVRFISGFEATGADTFDILSAGTLVGTFSGVAEGDRINTADGVGSFQVNYVGDTVRLSNYLAVPEPSTFGLFAIVLPGMLYRRRRSK